MYCSPNTNALLAQDIGRIGGSLLVPELGTYLGVPLVYSHVATNTYQHLIDRVHKRLTAWKKFAE